MTEDGDVHGYSDKNIKENIKPFTGALDIVMKLHAKRYDLKSDHYKNIHNEKREAFLMEARRNKIGFIAQEVNEVLPEAVEYDGNAELYCMSKTALIPVLTEAIKEQQAIIDDLIKEIEEIKNNCCSTFKSSSIDVNNNNLTQLQNKIYQNTPNPFSHNTNIKYYLLKEVIEAQICIYNMNGKQLKSYPIAQRGEGGINIDGGELTAGLYTYALIADGVIVGTKKMVLTSK